MDCLTTTCATRWRDSGMRFGDLSGGDVDFLAIVMRRLLAKAGLGVFVTRIEYNVDRDGYIKSASIDVASGFLSSTPAVEFKDGGLVVVAGWFLGDSEACIAEAFLAWLDFMQRKKTEETPLELLVEMTLKGIEMRKGGRGDG